MEDDIDDVGDDILNITTEEEDRLLENDMAVDGTNENAVQKTVSPTKDVDKIGVSKKKFRKSAQMRIDKRLAERENMKRKLSDNKTPEDIEKNASKRGNNAQTPPTAPSNEVAMEDQLTGSDPPRSFSEVTKEISMAVIPRNYPESVLTEQEYHSFNSYLGIRMDTLPPETPLPNFVFTNYVQGYGAYKCTDESSAAFLRKTASEYNITQELVAIPQNELPSLPIFRSFTRDRDFTRQIFLKRIPRQNMGLGLDTSQWKIFNIKKEKKGTSFNIEMDAPSAAKIMKLEIPERLTMSQLQSIGNTRQGDMSGIHSDEPCTSRQAAARDAISNALNLRGSASAATNSGANAQTATNLNGSASAATNLSGSVEAAINLDGRAHAASSNEQSGSATAADKKLK